MRRVYLHIFYSYSKKLGNSTLINIVKFEDSFLPPDTIGLFFYQFSYKSKIQAIEKVLVQENETIIKWNIEKFMT